MAHVWQDLARIFANLAASKGQDMKSAGSTVPTEGTQPPPSGGNVVVVVEAIQPHADRPVDAPAAKSTA